jgi:hypothetical protein
MKNYLIILLFISSICSAQNNDVLKIYKLVPETVYDFYNQKVDTTTLYGEISKEMIEKIEIERNFFRQGEFIVNIKLKENYWQYFQSITEKFIGLPMGISFNDELISTPIVNTITREGGLGLYLSSLDKSELVYNSLGGKKGLQELPAYFNDDFYPNLALLFEQNVPVDSMLLLSANAILSTPDDYRVKKRNEIFEDIFEWFLKNSDKSYLIQKEFEDRTEIDSFVLKIDNANSSLFPYYVVCLTKVTVENRNLSDIEVKIKATECLIEYIFNETNYTEYSGLYYEDIKQNEFLKSLKNRENIRLLIENIDSLND